MHDNYCFPFDTRSKCFAGLHLTANQNLPRHSQGLPFASRNNGDLVSTHQGNENTQLPPRGAHCSMLPPKSLKRQKIKPISATGQLTARHVAKDYICYSLLCTRFSTPDKIFSKIFSLGP